MVEGVMDRMQELPILLVVSYRPEFSPQWVGRAGTSLIALGRLNRRQSIALAAEVRAKQPLSQELQERIIAQADGVPLFIEELTRAALEDCGSPMDRSPPIPGTVHALLMARLDHLPMAKCVAQIGAVIGREFPQTLVAAAASMSEAQMSQGLDELVASGLATRRGAPTDAIYIFKHALVQDAIYGTLLREPRRALHTKIAGALEKLFPTAVDNEPEILAHHCLEGGLTEEALRWYLHAGTRAASISANAEAVSQLNRGLSLTDSIPDPESQSRWRLELSLALLTPLISTYGYTSPELDKVLDRVLE